MPRVKDPTQYNGYIQAIVNDLGIDEVKVSWRAYIAVNVAGIAYRTGRVVIGKGYGKVETMRIIAHELRHIYQFNSGMFPDKTTWMGKTYENNKIKRGKIPTNYFEQPWEDDAEKYAKEATNKFKHLVKGVK